MKNDNLKLKIAPVLVNFFKFLCVIFIFSFLVFNLVSSQLISPLYYQIVKEDRGAVVSFLSKTKSLPAFSLFLEMSKNIYGNSLEQEVFAEDNKRKEMITKFESFLERNPKSRDLLYNLYLLYKEGGDGVKAEEYLKKAKEVDPMIKN